MTFDILPSMHLDMEHFASCTIPKKIFPKLYLNLRVDMMSPHTSYLIEPKYSCSDQVAGKYAHDYKKMLLKCSHA